MIILYVTSQKILVYLYRYNNHKELNISNISRNLYCTYSYIHKLLNEMRTLGLISIEKIGRSNIIKLTEKGESIALKFNEIYNELGIKI